MIRHQGTGLYLGANACTADAGQALRFGDDQAARRFLARHACEREGLELVERASPAAA